jgi:2-desacetyl-2-hydroxyethyl bacteriochlorophyllide A dehydrogenase
VPGYQAAGVVREVGAEVTHVRPGDRVFSASAGRWGRAVEGSDLHYGVGGHVGHHVSDSSALIKLPDGVSTREAAGLALAQVGYNGATRPRVVPGDVAVVVGDGLVGLYAGQVLRLRGAFVILAGHHADRMALASRHGAADEVIDSTEQDLREVVLSRYPEGVPITVETASKQALIHLCVDLLERDGQFVLLGYYPDGECHIDTHWVRRRETTVYCPNGIARERMERTLGLIAQGKMHVAELITDEFPYDQAAGAFRMIMDKPRPFLGVVLDWRQC